jgi:hypothetical protein
LALNGFGIASGPFDSAFGSNGVHLFADVGLINAELQGKVDDVTCSPVESQA